MTTRIGYKTIAAALREQMDSGTLPPGAALPSERELGLAWGVERTTVRRALALLADEKRIEKHAGIGSVVCRRQTPGQDLPLIPFIVFDPGNPYTGDIITHHFLTPVYRAFSALCGSRGYRTVSMGMADTRPTDRFDEILDSAAAVVLADDVSPAFLEQVRARGLPCVLLSAKIPGVRCVLCDNESGMTQAVTHLASLGHTQIAYLGGDTVFWNAQARADGFRRALRMVSADDRKPVISLCGWMVEDGVRGMHALLDAHPDVTAVCAANDFVALGACRAAEERGLIIGKSMSVVGFGDTVDAALMPQKLTTVRIPHEGCAKELFRAVCTELEEPYRNPAAILCGTELILRNSTGAPDNKNRSLRNTSKEKENAI